MSVDLVEFVPQHNMEVLNAIRREASPAYQARIPVANRADIQGTIQNLMRFTPQRNEFMNALVNQIGGVIVRNQIWTNPLAVFKQGWLQFGDTIEEVQIGLAEGNAYDVDREALEKAIFGVERTETQSAFHKVNRETFYKLTIKPAMLQRAFESQYGLSDFIVKQMSILSTSDQWDEFLITSNLLKEFYRNKGFFKVQIGDLSNLNANASDSKFALKSLRAMADTLPYLSRNYNPARMPMAVQREDLVLITTPEFSANVDVEALAGAFNLDKVSPSGRNVIIPREYWNIPGAQAVLTTKDLLVLADSRIETTSADNPAALHTNHFLHHHGVYSTSPFASAILFTTEAADTITIIDYPVVAISDIVLRDRLKAAVTTATRGQFYAVEANAITAPVGGSANAVRYELWGATSPRSYVTNTGMLYVGIDETATTLRVVVVAVADNDNRAEIDIPLTGTVGTLWPAGTNIADDSLTVTPNAPTRSVNTITIVATTNVTYKNANTGAILPTGALTPLTTGQVLNVEAIPADGYSIADNAISAWTYVGS